MAEIDEKTLKKTFVEALNEVFGNKNIGNLTGTPTRTSVSDSMINSNSNGYMGRNAQGQFDDSDTFASIIKRIRDFDEQTKKVLEHNEKVIKDLKEAYANFSSNLNEEEKTRMRAQVDLEEALYEQDAARKKNITLETENSARYIRIKTKNQEQELELENKRLKFQEENLEKTQAIAKVQQDIELTKKKYELKGYKQNGKKNAGAELFEAIGKTSAFLKGNSIGRIAGEAVSKTSKTLTTGVNFLGSDKKLSFSDIGNKVNDIAKNFGPIGAAVGGIAQLITSIVEQYDKINAASSKYVRSVGGGIAKMEQMKMDAVQIASNINKWGGNAYRFNEILEHISELSSKTGRVMDHMSELDIKSLEDLTRHGISSETLNMYDTFGLSMRNIDERITNIYKTSGKHGLNAKAVTDTVNKNLKMAQNYTFAGGLRALERMAQKSVALKYNMESVSRFADKVSTLEGAATAGAQLSVLGGDFARMGNPLTMLYGGLQDMEQLNDMMLNMTKNMAQWDSDKGQMEITAYNRQRLRAAADAMGVDYSELVNQAMTQGKRNRIDNQLDMAGKINNDDTREYIRNLAQLDEEGRAYIRFSGDENPTYLENLTEGDKERLKKESEDMAQKNSATIGDIYMNTRTLTDKMNDYIEWFRSKFFEVILKIAGYGDKEKAKIKGVNAGNADFYNQMSDDYYWGGMSDSGLIKLKDIFGLKEDGEEYQKIKNRDYSDAEFDDFLTKELLKKQKEGYTYNGTSFVKSEETEEKAAHGGIIRGKGTSMSDSIPAMLSNGEFVMNAKATNKHLPTLQAWNADGFNSGTILPIRAGSNQTNPLSVKENISGVGGNKIGTQKLAIEPISINVSGTINLTGGGSTKSLDIKQLLDNNTFISYLTRQIEKSINFSFNAGESKSHMPYYIPMT